MDCPLDHTANIEGSCHSRGNSFCLMAASTKHTLKFYNLLHLPMRGKYGNKMKVTL
jgi:hypothetical protein